MYIYFGCYAQEEHYCCVKKSFSDRKLGFRCSWFRTASLIDLEKLKVYILDFPACFLGAGLRQMRQYISAKMFQIVNLGTKLSRARNYFWIGQETEEELSAEKDIHFLASAFDFLFSRTDISGRRSTDAVNPMKKWAASSLIAG